MKRCWARSENPLPHSDLTVWPWPSDYAHPFAWTARYTCLAKHYTMFFNLLFTKICNPSGDGSYCISWVTCSTSTGATLRLAWYWRLKSAWTAWLCRRSTWLIVTTSPSTLWLMLITALQSSLPLGLQKYYNRIWQVTWTAFLSYGTHTCHHARKCGECDGWKSIRHLF